MYRVGRAGTVCTMYAASTVAKGVLSIITRSHHGAKSHNITDLTVLVKAGVIS